MTILFKVYQYLLLKLESLLTDIVEKNIKKLIDIIKDGAEEAQWKESGKKITNLKNLLENTLFRNKTVWELQIDCYISLSVLAHFHITVGGLLYIRTRRFITFSRPLQLQLMKIQSSELTGEEKGKRNIHSLYEYIWEYDYWVLT